MVTPLISAIPPTVRAKPTNRDLLDEMIRFHACLHSVDQKVEAVQGVVNTVQLDLEHVKGVQEGITTRLGVPNAPAPVAGAEAPAPVKPAFAISFVRPWKAWAGIIGGTGGIVILCRLLFDVLPAVWSAFYHAIMTVKL